MNTYRDINEIRPQPWSAVVRRYATIEAARPLQRLAEAIEASPYADRLYPVTSMFDIIVYGDASSVRGHDCLVIRFNFDKAFFIFEYVEHPSVRKQWRKESSIDESFSAFIHFLALKRWFRVAEIPRGSWACT